MQPKYKKRKARYGKCRYCGKKFRINRGKLYCNEKCQKSDYASYV